MINIEQLTFVIGLGLGFCLGLGTFALWFSIRYPKNKRRNDRRC